MTDRVQPWLVVGPSRVAAFQACPRRYYLRYVLRMAAGPVPQVGTGLGLAVHAELHARHANPALHDETEPLTDALSDPKVLNLVGHHGAVCPRDQADYLGGEINLWWLWRRDRVLLHGRVDAVWRYADGTVEVRDYKTWGGSRDLAQDFGVAVYALLAAGAWRDAEALAVTIESLSAGGAAMQSLRVTRDVLSAATDQVVVWAQRVRAEEAEGKNGFTPTPSPETCVTCEFSYCCPASAAELRL